MQSNPRSPYRLPAERPKLAPPDGKPLIVHVVVNIEHWQFDQPIPRLVMTPPQGRGQVPDVPNFSWGEYGNRCGMPRLIKLLSERGLPVTASINAGVIDVYPSLAQAVLDAGWEFMGHGIHQRSVGGESQEAELIQLALDKIAGFTGAPPRGWLGPGLAETFDTPDLLKAAGIEYVCATTAPRNTWISARRSSARSSSARSRSRTAVSICSWSTGIMILPSWGIRRSAMFMPAMSLSLARSAACIRLGRLSRTWQTPSIL